MVETAEEKGQDEFDEVEAMVGEPVKFNFFFCLIGHVSAQKGILCIVMPFSVSLTFPH